MIMKNTLGAFLNSQRITPELKRRKRAFYEVLHETSGEKPTEGYMANPNDNRPTFRPYLAYLERYGDRKRAQGELSPETHDDAYWQERRQNEEEKNAGR